jgi:hypothetical protein
VDETMGAVTPNGQWDGWTLSGLSGERMVEGGMPPALRGDFLKEYLARGPKTTAKSVFTKRDPRRGNFGKDVDALRPLDYQARINRTLGFKAKHGQPTFIYWHHLPIMRLQPYGETPHILISSYHARAEREATRALFAANNVLDYLLTGVRLSQKGIAITRRHETTPWPRTLNKPDVYIPVQGRNGKGLPFWDAINFQLVSCRPLAYAGGMEYEPVIPFAAGTPIAYDDEETDEGIEGLI